MQGQTTRKKINAPIRSVANESMNICNECRHEFDEYADGCCPICGGNDLDASVIDDPIEVKGGGR